MLSPPPSIGTRAFRRSAPGLKRSGAAKCFHAISASRRHQIVQPLRLTARPGPLSGRGRCGRGSGPSYRGCGRSGG